MKTNELVKQVETLGYEVKWHDTSFGDCLYILNKEKDTVARVNSQYRYNFGTSQNFYLETEKKQGELFGLLTEYSKTPIEEREEKKKYHLQLRGAGISEFSCYLNRLYNTTFFFAGDEEGCGVKTKFTDEEISELPDWVSDMLRDGYLVKGEIKDDNEN